jgi:hypothetical protein
MKQVPNWARINEAFNGYREHLKSQQFARI